MTTATEARKFISFPETTVETDHGRLTVVGNGGTSLYIHTENKPGHRDVLTVRGVDYHVSAHLTLKDGEWVVFGNTPSEQRTYLYVSRLDFGKEPTETARKAIGFIVLQVAKQTDTTELRRQGRLATVNNDIQSLDRKIEEAAAALAAMESERAALQAEEVILKMDAAGQ